MPGQADPSSSRWRDLRRRAISAAVLAPVAVGGIWLGGIVFATITAAALILAVLEWVRLCRRARAPGMGAIGTAWILLAGAGLVWLRADPVVGLANLLFLALLVWTSDIGAYLVGRVAGGPKLAPRISPGKTWSGAIGGIVAAILVGLGAAWLMPTGPGLARAALLALVLCVIGQFGDLTESWAKRRSGVKDSGSLIPGHGGILDRLDATLAVAPVAALLALGLGRGVLLWG